MIDLLLGLVLLGYVISGFRQGLLVALLSLVGFLGGGALAMWGLPPLLERWMTPQTADMRRVIVIVVGVLALASIGQAIGVAIGTRMRSHVRARPARALDSVLGAGASLAAVCILVWLIAGALRSGPVPSLSRAIGQSRIVAAIDQVVPPSSGRVFASFRTLLDAEGFPRVFEGVGPEQIRAVAPPDPAVADTAGVRRAVRSVVKVTGLASACDRTQEGSGWVVAADRVVTNAHVVAGVARPSVRIAGLGRAYPGRVVVFDPIRDLAVIDVPGLPAAPLRVGGDLPNGATAVVAGFPLDGPYRVDSARVREVLTARGQDIYGSRTSIRQVYSLFARVQPGNSGGPLLAPSGKVVGVVFAKSLDDVNTGYALTASEAAPVLARAAGATRAVPVGGCAAG